MKDIALRIRELIDHLGLSNKSFAESIDIAPAIISHVLSGRNNPSLHLVQQITNVYTNVNLAYLLNGDGELLNDLSTTEQKAPMHETNTPLTGQAPSQSLSTLPPGARYVSPPSGAPIPHSSQDDLILPETDDALDLEEKVAESSAPTRKKGRRKGKSRPATGLYEAEGKEIERIVVFYTDRSFREYHPED